MTNITESQRERVTFVKMLMSVLHGHKHEKDKSGPFIPF